MQQPSRQQSKLGRGAGLGVLAALAALVVACAGTPEPAPGHGRLELSIGGVSARGQRYRVEGSYFVRGLSNGVTLGVASSESPSGAVLRRDLPAGLYSVALVSPFAREPARPQVVLVEAGKVTCVEARSLAQGAPPAAALARR